MALVDERKPVTGAGAGAPKPVARGEEKLPLRSGEFELSYSRARALPLFDDLTPRMEGRLQGRGGRGAVVLRRFRTGDVICRQGDPGWTAFYLIRNKDIIGLREKHRDRADAADAQLATRLPDLLRLSPAERRRRAEELEPGGSDVELAELLFASSARPEEGEMEALYAEEEILDAGDAADAALAAYDPSLAALAPEVRLRRAESIEAEKAGTAGDRGNEALHAMLQASSRAAERRVRMAVSGTRPGSGPRSAVAPGGPLARLKAMLRIGGGGARAGHHSERPRSDENPDEDPIATLYEGELFGELSCLHQAPRTATVRALRDCYAIEVLDVVLRFLLDSKAFREEVDLTYRSRGLAQLLRAVPLFARASDEVIELLRSRAELVSRAPGGMIFEEGDPSDSLYVVRSGTVRVVLRSAGDRVLGYRSRGEVIGEYGLVSGDPRRATCIAYRHPRDPSRPPRRLPPEARVELVRIARAVFDEACALDPTLRDEALRAAGPVAAPPPVLDAGASRIHELGLMQGRNLLLVDVDRCTRCNECVRACAESHDDHLPRLALDGPRFDGLLVATSCRSCSDPVCLVGCPVGAIHQGRHPFDQRGAAGEIVIESWCTGCGLCAAQCPYGAIELRALARSGGGRDDDREAAVVCDQCAGVAGGPRCVSACAHDAAIRVDARSFFAGGARPRRA